MTVEIFNTIRQEEKGVKKTFCVKDRMMGGSFPGGERSDQGVVHMMKQLYDDIGGTILQGRERASNTPVNVKHVEYPSPPGVFVRVVKKFVSESVWVGNIELMRRVLSAG